MLTDQAVGKYLVSSGIRLKDIDFDSHESLTVKGSDILYVYLRGVAVFEMRNAYLDSVEIQIINEVNNKEAVVEINKFLETIVKYIIVLVAGKWFLFNKGVTS